MNLDWRRLKAVVIESDDWGLCAWSPDAQAHRVLTGMPAFRTTSGRRYGGSTLESAADMRAMMQLLGDVRGADGMPAVLQANTIMASPDYAALQPPLFPLEGPMPLMDFPETRGRWARPGLREALTAAQETGQWWPELHGLHHLPEQTWVDALRRGVDDARRAHEQESPICTAVEAAGEYDDAEPRELRLQNLRSAVRKFEALFGRTPTSFCPPDYRWGSGLDHEAKALGLTTFQGEAERARARMPRLRRLFHRVRWPSHEGERFAMPPRIAFEPMGSENAAHKVGVERALRSTKEAWTLGQPAILSTHRLNYVHLQPGWADNGRMALHDLLQALVKDGARFMIDAEVRQLVERGWSVRPMGSNRSLLRYYGVPGQPVTFDAPEGATAVAFGDDTADDTADISLDAGKAVARVNVGEFELKWRTA